MGLENQVCYNGGAQGSKCKQSRFPLIGAIAPPPPAAGGNLKKGTNRLIIIEDTDLDVETLEVTPRSYFKRSTYIEKESADFWENLLYSLPIERMGVPHQRAQQIHDGE